MTYFITGDQPIPATVESHLEANDGEVCSNLYYLGKKGTQTTANGLKIAFLSGVEGNGYTDDDVQSLKSTKMPITTPPGVDILLTHLWPSGIENGSKVIQTAPAAGSQAIASLAAALKPRYYFAAAEKTFCEREPYKNVTGFGPPDERPAEHVTRFIGLGDALNDSKQRVNFDRHMPYLERLTLFRSGFMHLIWSHCPNRPPILPLFLQTQPTVPSPKRQLLQGRSALILTTALAKTSFGATNKIQNGPVQLEQKHAVLENELTVT